MSMDPVVSELLLANGMQSLQSSSNRLAIIGENAVQALTVIQDTVVQGNATVTDDSALFAAMQTASKVPVQGQA